MAYRDYRLTRSMSQEENSGHTKIFSGPGQRLKTARFASGFRQQKAFGKELGDFSAEQVGRAERGENPVPSEMLEALASKFGISPTWLLTGEGPMYIKEAGPVVPMGEGEVAMEQARLETTRADRLGEADRRGPEIVPAEDLEHLKARARREFIPIMGRSAAGLPSLETDGDQAVGWADRFVRVPGAPRGCFAVEIRGRSMAPDYPPGCLVLVGEEIVVACREALALVFLEDESGEVGHTLKMVRLSPDSPDVILRPLNPDYETRAVPGGRVKQALGVLGRIM